MPGDYRVMHGFHVVVGDASAESRDAFSVGVAFVVTAVKSHVAVQGGDVLELFTAQSALDGFLGEDDGVAGGRAAFRTARGHVQAGQLESLILHGSQGFSRDVGCGD